MTDCDKLTGQNRNVKAAKVTFIKVSIKGLTRTARTDLSHGVRHHHLGRAGTDRNMLMVVRMVVRLGVAAQVGLTTD